MAPGPDAEKQSALEDAKGILSQILQHGPLLGKKVTAEAVEAGLSERTIRRARTALGIRPVKDGFNGGWIWALPTKASEDGEDGQRKSLDTFGDSGHLRAAFGPETAEPTSQVLNGIAVPPPRNSRSASTARGEDAYGFKTYHGD